LTAAREERLKQNQVDRERRDAELRLLAEKEAAKLEAEKQRIQQEKERRDAKQNEEANRLDAELKRVQDEEAANLKAAALRLEIAKQKAAVEQAALVVAQDEAVRTAEKALAQSKQQQQLLYEKTEELKLLQQKAQEPRCHTPRHIASAIAPNISKSSVTPKRISKSAGEIKKLQGTPDIWQALANRLPTGKTAEDKRKRKALFHVHAMKQCLAFAFILCSFACR